MEKNLVFDMDGTIVNFYGVCDWLNYILEEDDYPYRNAEPLYNMNDLNLILETLKMFGWKIIVTTWLARGASESYNKKVAAAKEQWLNRYNFPYDELNICKYGTNKTKFSREGGIKILIDDDDAVRSRWNIGESVDANQDILEYLKDLLKKEN